jgi:transposase
VLRAGDREKIEAIVRVPSTEQRVAKRGQAILLLADAVATADVAMLVGVNERTVRKWKNRFDCESPVDKLADDPRSGRPASLSRPPMQLR